MRPRRDIASGTPAHRVLSCEPSGAPPVRAASCFGRNPAARQSQRGFSLSYAAVRHLLPAGVADASATCGAGLCRRYQELQRISRKAPKQSACPWLAPPLRAARMRRSTEVIIPCAAAIWRIMDRTYLARILSDQCLTFRALTCMSASPYSRIAVRELKIFSDIYRSILVWFFDGDKLDVFWLNITVVKAKWA